MTKSISTAIAEEAARHGCSERWQGHRVAMLGRRSPAFLPTFDRPPQRIAPDLFAEESGGLCDRFEM